MNTPALPDHYRPCLGKQPGFFLFYEDGTKFQGEAGEWTSQSTLETVDGISVYLTKRPVTSLLILDEDSPHYWTIALPTPLPMFAFARFSTLLGVGTTNWRYSVFGYLYLEQRFLFTVYPEHTMVSVTPRSEPFLLS